MYTIFRLDRVVVNAETSLRLLSSRQTPARSMFMDSSAPVHYHHSMHLSKLGTTCQVRMNRVKYAAKQCTLAYRIYATF